MNIYKQLTAGEQLLSEFKPFYATSRRILRYEEKAGAPAIKELPYYRLDSIEMVRTPRHNLMMTGTAVVIGALLATFMGLIAFTTIPAIVIGLAVLFYGGAGKEGYYQLHIRNADRNEERLWRVKYEGSGTFIATLRSIIGDMPDF